MNEKLYGKRILILLLLVSEIIFSQTVEEKVESLLSQMTLIEKIGQMNQYNGFWNFT